MHFVTAAELLPCQGAHNTEKLQVGWKAQWRRVTMLKISKCFMQAWCIIVREMKCVCSELKLGWLSILQGHWDVNRKGKVVGFYVHWIFFVPWSLIPWICKYLSDVSGVILSCGMPRLMCWVLGQLRDCSPGLQVGQCHFILSVGHMGSLTLKLLEYGYALTHDKNVISMQSCSQASFGEKRWWWSLSRLSKSVRANKYERYSR